MSQNPTLHPTTSIADTCNTSHYICPSDTHKIIAGTTTPIIVGLPNVQQLTSTNFDCELNLPQVPTQGRQAHLLPGLTHRSLLSISQLFDAGCQETFDQKSVIITNHGYTILTGHRDFSTGLRRIPLSMTEPSPQQQINSTYHTKYLPDLVTFHHAVAFSPSTTTWINAIKNVFPQSWPGLTTKVVSKYLTKSPATTIGHMDQTYKHVRSTETDQPISQKNDQQDTNNNPTHNVFLPSKRQ